MSDSMLRQQDKVTSPSLAHSVSCVDGGDGAATAHAAAASKGGLSTSPNSAPNASPLQLFVKAKKKINEIYGEVGDYVTSAHSFLSSSPIAAGAAVSHAAAAAVPPSPSDSAADLSSLEPAGALDGC